MPDDVEKGRRDPFAGGSMRSRYHVVRRATASLCEPLEVEDYVVQSMPDVSPTKWHLAHTSWFFERFILTEHVAGYRVFDPSFDFLFNSYYQTVGPMHARPERGVLSRPTVRTVWRYRSHVDEAMDRLLEGDDLSPELGALVELGLQHEQQHQELILTDIQHVLWSHPCRPAYRPPVEGEATSSMGADTRRGMPQAWVEHSGGVVWIGAPDDGKFAFDNERPCHRRWLEPFRLAVRLTTQAEYLEFIEDGGYRRPELWLSDGWERLCEKGWEAPLYWERSGNGAWKVYGLRGLQPLDSERPVVHVSYYEADAFARWRQARLADEAEWEVMAQRTAQVTEGVDRANLLESDALQPLPAAPAAGGVRQLWGDAWEWTRSPYQAYPGFRPWSGSLGEYNGKFMCNQLVLRGGSYATPTSHLRATYRNFFAPDARWQISGIRLAQDLTAL